MMGEKEGNGPTIERGSDKRITGQSIYSGDSIRINIKGYKPAPHPVPYGTNVEGVLFDGYPQIIKKEPSAPSYKVKKEKDIMITMRDGVRICLDVYRPDGGDEKFPALLAYGMWGKDLQEAVSWLADKPQPYYDSPFWDGTMEAGNYDYTVPRGYAHIIPDPRGIGNSEGYGTDQMWDVYDTVEWIAAQPWCNGKVAMIGPSSYSAYQVLGAATKPPHLLGLRPDECMTGTADYFHGIFDTIWYHIPVGKHGNDSFFVYPNYPYTPLPPRMLSHPDIGERIREALEHPDIKYNSKWYAHIKYPQKFPMLFDSLLTSLHPQPGNPYVEWEMLRGGPFIRDITIPIYAGTPWVTRFYIWSTFEAFEFMGTPKNNKKLIVYPPAFPDRPYVQYHDENVRWYDYWLKGLDNGIMDEPPIKMFVMGINKWRFENEWPLARTKWTKFYLQPGGGLSVEPPAADKPETLTQPAPYLDPTVYCLRYNTGPLDKDTEVTGPLALYLSAEIDIDDTNWMADLVDVDPEGNKQWISSGHLKAAHRAVDTNRSRPYLPIHPMQDPVYVPPGQVIEYAIAMMPTSNVFKRGHSMELIIRNQDDLLSRLGTWGVYMSPFMRTVTHTIHFGNSHLLLPIIPA